jgi:hypothetical protein
MVVACATTAFAFGFPVVLADVGPGPLFYYRLLLFPGDVALAITLVAAAAFGATRKVRPGLATVLLAAMTAVLAVALAVHPSPQGVQTVARFAGAVGLAYAMSLLDRDERLVTVGALAALVVVQVGLAVAQIGTGGPLGLASFGEVADPLRDYAGAIGPRGTMHAMYVLAGLGLIAAFVLVREGLTAGRAALGFGFAAIAASLVGMTFSRAAAAGLVAACVALALAAPARRRAAAAAILCLVLGAGIPALLLAPGWLERASTSLRGRDTLLAESLGLISDAPIAGIGPGRTLFVLPLRYPDPPEIGYQPAHDVPLLAAVEGGVPAGAVALALLVALAWRSRRDLAAAALYLAFLPFVLTDHYPYTYMQGVTLFALWIGALDGLSHQTVPVLAPHPGVIALIERIRRALPGAPERAGGRRPPAG